MILKKLRSVIVYWKIMIARSTSYLTFINAGMLLFLFLTSIKNAGIISWDLGKYSILIFGVSIVVITLVGYIDINLLKGMKEEYRRVYSLVPPHPELLERLQRIEEKLNTKKKEYYENETNREAK